MRRNCPLRFLLVPLGSEGDVAPFVWLADQLCAGGHSVEIATNPHFATFVTQRGHVHVPVGTAEQLEELVNHPQLWNGIAGSRLLLEFVLRTLPESTRSLLASAAQADVVVGSTFALAGSLAAEVVAKPFVRVHLQPAALRSVRDLPVLGPRLGWLRRWPAPALRLFFRAVDYALDAQPLRELNTFRRSLGLPSVHSFYRDVFNSGAGIAALFPSWFAPPQPDWPPQVKQFGFPLETETPRPAAPENVQTFLDAGPPPVVWTHGSANYQADAFLAAAEASCRALRVRGILVAPGLDDLGAGPPSGDMLRLNYAPFAALFPYCRAVVHHGGIGTLTKALRAGLPQLIIPRAYDQFDNAARAERLGFGLALPYRRLGRATQRLRTLLERPGFATRARELAPSVTPATGVVTWLESLAAKAWS